MSERRMVLGKRYTAINILLILAGIAAIAGGKIIDDSWLQGVLVNVGTTFFLFAPLLFLGRGVERRLDRVVETQQDIRTGQEQAASNVEELRNEVTDTRRELDDVRQEVSEAVMARLREDHDEDEALFTSLNQTPSQQAVADALRRAATIGLIAHRGVRIPVYNADVFARFRSNEVPNGPAVVLFDLEDISGQSIDGTFYEWNKASLEDFLVLIGEFIQSAGAYPGDELYDPQYVIKELQKVLLLAHEAVTTGRLPITRIVQVSWPQWAVTESALICLNSDHPYEIPLRPSRRIAFGLDLRWPEEIATESWFDVDSFNAAHAAAISLFENSELKAKPAPF